MATIQNSAQSSKGSFPRRRFSLLLGMTLLVILLVGSWLAQRLWWPAAPAPTITGELVARQMAAALQSAPDVQSAAGAYVPGESLLLYSRLAETDRERVRMWALLQLEPFHKLLIPLAADERLQWVIDFGPNGTEQEIILVPFNQVADAAQYRYISSTPGSLTDTGATATSPAAGAAAQPPAPGAPPVGSAATMSAGAQRNEFTFTDPATSGQNWSTLAGEWVIENGVYSQRRTTGYDYITMLNLEPQSDYQLEAQIRLVTGEMGGGFIYNAPTRETRRGAQIIDFVEQGAFLRWGRYDEQGNYVYVGGVRVDPPINDGQWHTLQLLTHATTSTVALNGRVLGQISNSSLQGYLGLTTSQAQVDFRNVVVVGLAADGPLTMAADAEQPAPEQGAPDGPIAGFADDFATGSGNRWRVLNGVWQFVDQGYQQMSTVGLDLGSISTFQGETYTATVRLQRLAGSMGGGLYFNMAQRDAKMRSQVINYTRDGKALQWGYFDEGGNFVLEQVVDVPDGGDGAWHQLSVAVRQGQATFTLDDVVIAQEVPLTYGSGYVGLFVSNSQVAFDDFAIVTP
ncbi:MAG: DUF1080 domain-containing protein [Caldilinea sp. CFX5]|nr:DUF1080 domain-containing protein [Caldilinea sp. CFX5]